MHFRALSYNVHKLFNLTRSKYFLKELKSLCLDLELDFLFLQEIRGEQPQKYAGHFKDSPLEHLADSIWQHYAYGKNAVYTSGHHGNAILSK